MSLTSAATSPATPAVTMTGRQLRDLTGSVLNHVATGRWQVPLLTMVQVEVSHNVLHLIATDTYTLAVARHPLDGPGGDLTLHIPATTLTAVARTIRVRDQVRLSLTPQALILDRCPAPELPSCIPDPELTYRIPAVESQAPLPWRKHVAKALHRPPNATVEHPLAIRNAFLARFQTAAFTGQPLQLHPPGSHKQPILITSGPHFLGLLMPIGLDDRADQATELTPWTTLCPANAA
ncbi:hypothetical protein ACIBG8_46885 [Nonomuraea sp. NPDC050556]|uniref:hypothetical protein n=1 Tax=Nonomuraea sp. NPDC050556 TaxID=3364369 RepID=UPI0037958E87